MSEAYETILTETRGRVLVITLNRPKALNAINAQLTREVIRAATEADADPGIGCIVVTGSAKAFAAGADIKEMQHSTYAEMYAGDRFGDWERFTAGVPAGFDALHYGLQSAVARRRQSPAATAVACVQAAPRSLAPFGVPAAGARLVAVLYLTELSVRYLADRQAEAGARLGRPGAWLIPAIKEAVIQL